MGIDINLAKSQANELSQQAAELRIAVKKLSEYKTSLKSYWKGKEVSPIITAIDNNIKKIKKVIEELEDLETDIKKAANDIKREEDAAAARARAEKQQRIKAAREAYDTAAEKLEELKNQKEQLIVLYTSIPHTQENYPRLMQIYNNYQLLIKSIEEAEEECELCLKNLKAAER